MLLIFTRIAKTTFFGSSVPLNRTEGLTAVHPRTRAEYAEQAAHEQAVRGFRTGEWPEYSEYTSRYLMQTTQPRQANHVSKYMSCAPQRKCIVLVGEGKLHCSLLVHWIRIQNQEGLFYFFHTGKNSEYIRCDFTTPYPAKSPPPPPPACKIVIKRWLPNFHDFSSRYEQPHRY